MEVMKMKKIVFPKPYKRMSRRMTLLLVEELQKAPKVPIEKLNREARDFEKNVLSSIYASKPVK